jgi:hypothetical protein
MTRGKLIFIISLIIVILATICFFVLKKYSTIFADAPSLPLPATDNSWVYYQDQPNTIYHYYQGQLIDYGIQRTMQNVQVLLEGYGGTKDSPENFTYNTNIAIINQNRTNGQYRLAIVYQRVENPATVGNYASIVLAGIYMNQSDKDKEMKYTYHGLKSWQVKDSNNNPAGYIVKFDYNFGGFTNKTNALVKQTLDYYNLVANQIDMSANSQKNAWVAYAASANASANLLPQVHESCKDNLPPENMTYDTAPDPLKQTIAAREANIRQMSGDNGFRLIKNDDQKQQINDYISHTSGIFAIQNTQDPLQNLTTIESTLTSSMNDLFADSSQIWTDPDFKTVDKTAFKGCAWATMDPLGIYFHSFSGTNLNIQLPSSTICAGLSNQLSKLMTKYWNDSYSISSVKANFLLYYTSQYVAYLNCVDTNSATPLAYKQKVDSALKDLGSRISVLTGGINEGDKNLASSQGSSFWDTLYASFMSIITNLMKTMMIWVWSLVSAAPL